MQTPIKRLIKKAIREAGTYIPIRVWEVEVGTPDFDGIQTMRIEVTVTIRKSKRKNAIFS